VGLGPLGTAGPLRGLKAAPAHQPPDALCAADGPAAERHYMVIYAAQEPGNHPRTSHCFATFARVAPERASSGGGAPGRTPSH
jgi:hypothetical protein